MEKVNEQEFKTRFIDRMEEIYNVYYKKAAHAAWEVYLEAKDNKTETPEYWADAEADSDG